MVNHHFTCQPEVVEGKSSIFASTVTTDALVPCKITVAEWATYPQLGTHIVQERLVRCCKDCPTRLLLSTAHRQTPEGEFAHRVDEEGTTVVKELALIVEHMIKVGWTILNHTTPQDNIVTTGNDIQGVHLHGFDSA